MIRRFKKWIVLRWLNVIPVGELQKITEDRKHRELRETFDKWYQNAADHMLKAFTGRQSSD